MNYSNNKGISPVIATLLLVVIAISAVSASWIWYESLWSGISTGVEGKANGDVSRLFAGLRIESATTVGYTLKNTGTVTLYTINVYEDGTLKATYSKFEPGKTITNYISLTAGETLYAIAKYADDKLIIKKAPIQQVGVLVDNILGSGNSTGLSVTTSPLPITSNLTEVN